MKIHNSALCLCWVFGLVEPLAAGIEIADGLLLGILYAALKAGGGVV